MIHISIKRLMKKSENYKEFYSNFRCIFYRLTSNSKLMKMLLSFYINITVTLFLIAIKLTNFIFSKKICPVIYNHLHKFWDFLIFSETFFLPKAKRRRIITYKDGMYDFPHKLLNDLSLPTALLPLGGLSCSHKEKDLEPY